MMARKTNVKTCEPTCLNCHGGRDAYIACDDAGECVLCHGVLSESRDEERASALKAKMKELRDVLKLYEAQFDLDDAMRSLTLARCGRVLAVIGDIDAITDDKVSG